MHINSYLFPLTWEVTKKVQSKAVAKLTQGIPMDSGLSGGVIRYFLDTTDVQVEFHDILGQRERFMRVSRDSPRI